MISKKLPKYLYHYTTIDSLALILKNHTIRLNNLDNVDDLDEALISEKVNYKKNIFVSSWTEYASENISLWNLYTPKMQGVRIKLPSMCMKVINTIKGEDADIASTEIIQHDKKYMLLLDQEILRKVRYVKKKDIYQQPIESTEDITYYRFNNLGGTKRDCWRFQKEWRYMICSVNVNQPNNKSTILSTLGFYLEKGKLDDYNKGNALIDSDKNIGTPSYIDLEIDDEAFKKMEITLSPCITLGQEEIVRVLLEKYNKTCLVNVKKSSLNIKSK